MITGVQRSGTTLLRLMLNAHPDIAVPEEADFIKPLLRKNALLEVPDSYKTYLPKDEQFIKWRLPQDSVLRLCDLGEPVVARDFVRQLYGYFAAHEGKKMIGDKSPSLIRRLNVMSKIFDQAKLLHIVRDPRDVYASLKARGHLSTLSPALFALEWRTKEALIQRNSRHFDKALTVRYEDLVNTTEDVLRDICHFLEVDFSGEMLSYHQRSTEYIDKGHSSLIFQKVSRKNALKWKDSLSLKESKVIEALTRPELGTHGYERVATANQLMTLFYWVVAGFFVGPRILQIVFRALSQQYFFKKGNYISKNMYQ